MQRIPAPTDDPLSPSEGAVTEPRELVVLETPDELPPVLAGHTTPEVHARAASFYGVITELF